MLTNIPEAGVRMLRSAATPNPRKHITMTENTTCLTPIGTAGGSSLRRLRAHLSVLSLRLIRV